MSLDPSNLTMKSVVTFLNDYQPKVYILSLILNNSSTIIQYAFSTQVDRLNFEKILNDKYTGSIDYLSRSELIFNPRCAEEIDRLNSYVK